MIDLIFAFKDFVAGLVLCYVLRFMWHATELKDEPEEYVHEPTYINWR